MLPLDAPHISPVPVMEGRDRGNAVNLSSRLSIVLDLPPSCIEFSPFHPECFIVGTYYLEPEAASDTTSLQQEDYQLGRPVQDRRGSLMLFHLSDLLQLTKRHTMDVPYAVLDLRFSPFRKGVFAIATSNGQVRLCTMNSGGTGPIEHIQSYQIFSDSTITLSLTWNSTLPHADTIAASSSNGQIAVFNTEDESPITYAKTVAHSLEAWALAWSSKGEENLSPCLYSGGDDSALCTHDLSFGWSVEPNLNNGIVPFTRYSFETSVQDTKIHMAGVTAILPLTLLPFSRLDHHLLLTGSYDEYVRLLLPINGRSRPKLLAERSLGGGVWSLKQMDEGVTEGDLGPAFRILASCMHAGAKILMISRGQDGEWHIDVLYKFKEHESMNYASTRRPKQRPELYTVVVSTSFYDKKLCVWEAY